MPPYSNVLFHANASSFVLLLFLFFFDLDMTTSLPPLNPLLQTCGKRTRDIFASGLEDSFKDEEKRCAPPSCWLVSVLTFACAFSQRKDTAVGEDERRVQGSEATACFSACPARSRWPRKAKGEQENDHRGT